MRRRTIRLALPFLGVAVVALADQAAFAADGMQAQIDELFAEWTRSDRPGCAMAAARDGRILIERGYGMSDLEQGVAIRPDTGLNSSLPRRKTRLSPSRENRMR